MAAPYKLHGVWLSGPTYKAGLMLTLTGQKFDYEFINLREGAGQKPEYKAKSRWGQVPCLTVGATGKNLVQSAAILGFLAQTTGKFAGANADEQQDIREWMLWEFDRLAAPIYRMRASKAGFRKFDPATEEMYTADGKAALKVLNDHLAGKSWVVGSAATIANIDIYGVVNYADPAGPADRYPTFYVYKLLTHYAHGGEKVVTASSDYSRLGVYAVRDRRTSTLNLLILNKHPVSAINAYVTVDGFRIGRSAEVYTYGIPQDEAARTGIGSTDVAQTAVTITGPTFTFAPGAYSATVIRLSHARHVQGDPDDDDDQDLDRDCGSD